MIHHEKYTHKSELSQIFGRDVSLKIAELRLSKRKNQLEDSAPKEVDENKSSQLFEELEKLVLARNEEIQAIRELTKEDKEIIQGVILCIIVTLGVINAGPEHTSAKLFSPLFPFWE
jgi:hypothetical protein